MRRWSLVAIAAAVAGIAWFGVDSSTESQPRPRKHAGKTDVVAPPAGSRPQPRAALPHTRPPALAQDVPDPVDVAAADAARSEPTAQEIAQTLDRALHAESVDPPWVSAMEARVADYFRSERAMGSSLVRSECRSTLCKLEVQHAGAESAERFVDDVSAIIPHGSNAVIQPSRDGAPRQTVVWFTRLGHAPMP